ncbi:MAG: C10 family peptidase, partial [Thermoplasmatota archaeon]
MRKKVGGILVCIMLVITATPVIGMPIGMQEQYSSDEDDSLGMEYTPGEWLLTTLWGQREPYNSKTPQDSAGDNYRLGCWSVAIGQIIRFHELQSHGEVVYLWGDLNTLVNDLDAFEYDWAYMPDELTANASYEEKENVAQLLYDTSTVIQKNFGTMGYCLSASEMVDELVEHFQYVAVQTTVVNNPSITNITTEIDHHRPCMLYLENLAKTSGHAVAIDGYQWVGREFQVHLNMGWYGEKNKFYTYNKPIDIYDNNSVRKVIFIRL